MDKELQQALEDSIKVVEAVKRVPEAARLASYFLLIVRQTQTRVLIGKN